jgi:hypothetical protein
MTTTAEWNGVTQAALLDDEYAAIRHALADASKSGDWPQVFKILNTNAELINTSRPDGKALYTPLHQAAYTGAGITVVRELIDLGAWRCLKNADGHRPVDVAARTGHTHLLEALEPAYKYHVPAAVLQAIQHHFHAVILQTIGQKLSLHNLRFPELEPLLELDECKMWFPVPGMYGGFSFWLDSFGAEAKLVSESWCRVAEGSGMRYEITGSGSTLVAEGFV